MTACALVGAAAFNAAHFAAQRFDAVVAVDGGLASLQAAGVAAHVAVGDFDSLGYVPDAADLRGAPADGGVPDAVPDVRVFPCRKDESDMELAVREARLSPGDALVMYGALGGRLDHTIANLQLLVGCARRGVRALAVGPDVAVAALAGGGEAAELAFPAFDPAPLDALAQGRYVSLFAFGGPAGGVTERGLAYQLEDATVPDDASLGLSNQFTGGQALIRVERGSAIALFAPEACPTWPPRA